MSSSDSEVENVASHAAALKRLKDKDPDFYEFLKTNDEKLLKFRASENDAPSDTEQVEDEGYDDVPSDTEQVEDGEYEDDDDEPQVLSPEYVEDLTKRIQSSPGVQVCKDMMLALNTVVEQIQGEDSTKVANSDIFNDVIKLCLVELAPALNTVLKVPKAEKEDSVFDVSKSRAWKKLSTCVKGYLADMLKILSTMTEPLNLTLLLKHIVQLVRYYVKSPKLSRMLLRKMISLWSSKEERVRVRALVVIYRMTKILDKDYLHYVSKHMYFAYVNNTKFTAPTSWPIINFMKHSLVEIYALDTDNAYENAFVYIRQLSIHLRNAVTVKKKEAFKVVYNWQYIHCMMLWAKLLGMNHGSESLKSLIYPLVQTTIGTINLIPTPKYFPLRFHLIRTLIKLSEETKVFIPILPLILDVLVLVDFNKKLGFTKKPINFICCLKLSKSQLHESGFKDGIIDQVCELLLEYFRIYCHNIGFPELALPSVMRLKAFTKKCKVTKYCQLIKQVIDKVSENSNFIAEKRKSVNFKIADDEKIIRWEENILAHGTPLLKYLKPKEKSCSETSRKRQKVASASDPDEPVLVD